MTVTTRRDFLTTAASAIILPVAETEKGAGQGSQSSQRRGEGFSSHQDQIPLR